MHKLLFGLIILPVIIFVIMLLQVGCYTNYLYTVKPNKIPINNDRIHIGFNRVYYNEEKMKYYAADTLGSGHTKNASYRISIVYSTYNISKDLYNEYNIDNVKVNIESLDKYIKLDKYSDIIRGPFESPLIDTIKILLRRSEFGPFKIEGSMPDSVSISFDMNMMSETGDSVIDKRHIEAVAKLNRESTIKAAFEL